MKAKTSYAEKVKETFYCFIKALVLNDKKYALFHVNNPNNVLKFIDVMCFSKNRAICNTGCILGKLLK